MIALASSFLYYQMTTRWFQLMAMATNTSTLSADTNSIIGNKTTNVNFTTASPIGKKATITTVRRFIINYSMALMMLVANGFGTPMGG
jgi:hypothetical protein